MPDDAVITVLGQSGNTPIKVQFNPAEYGYTRQARYSNPQSGKPAFASFEYQPFNVSLFYDTYEEGKDVREVYTNQIAALVEPSESGQEVMHQPECIFSWGGFNFKGFIERVEQKFTMFLQDGTPVRATVNITIVPTPMPQQIEKDLGRKACRKIWVVKSGDRLDLISNQVYKDPALWRKIANANNISNPLSFPTIDDVGTTLIIPDLNP
jgi:ABC-type phosphate transport system ATPase subunit